MARMQLSKTHRLGYGAVLGLEAYSRTHVEPGIYELLKLRASLLNSCQFCISMHTAALREAGESEARIAALADWESSALFNDRERAVLELTDSVTRLSEDGVSDTVWATAAAHFTDKELGNLVLAIATINVWNRIGVSTRLEEE